MMTWVKFGAAALVLVLIVAGAWLWTPDLTRQEAERRQGGAPSAFVEVLGLRLHLRDTGPRDAPPILLLHGFGSSLHTWDDWARLLETDRRVLRIDLPGFGLTGPDPSGDYSDQRFVLLVEELLDRLGIARIDILGSSMGGRLAWRFAADRPARVRRLVLMAPDGFASAGFRYGVPTPVPLAMRALPYTLPGFLLRGGLAPAYADAAALTVTSPVDGMILRVLQESERLVPAGFPLMEIGDPTDLEIRIEVLSRDGVAIRPGARVMLERWGGPDPLAARVRLVEPAAFTKISALGVEEQRVYVVADFTGPSGTRAALGDGYRVEARIVAWESADTLRAPAGALFQRDGAWQCFVLEHGRARLANLKVGRSNGGETEVLAGLHPGDRVIVYPGDQVREGARVRPLTVGAR